MTSANVSMMPYMTAKVKGSASPDKNTGGGGDFMAIMNASIKNGSAMDIKTSVGVDAPQKSDISVKSADTQAVSQDKTITTQNDTSDNTNTTAAVNTPVETKHIPQKEEATLTEEEIEAVTEVMAELAAEITQVIANDMQLPVEEVSDALDTLELVPAELSDPKNLFDLMGELTDMSGVELITEPAVVQVKEDIAPIIDELVSKLPVDSKEELPDFARDFMQMIDESSAADMDLGPDGEVVSAPQLMDELVAASDEIIINPENENLITEDIPEEAVVTPEVKKVDTPVERPYLKVDEDMDADETVAVKTYNDTTDEMAATARNMNSQKQGNGDGGASDAFAKKDGVPLEHAHVNVADNAPTAIVSEFAETITETVERYTTIDTRQIIDQIVTQVRTSVTEGVSTMALELHPATLGRMFVQVSEQDGTINAKLFAENENVKQALETQMSVLKEQWEQQGTKVNAIEISVATREFEEQMGANADWSGNQNEGNSGSGESGTEGGMGAGGSSIRSINLGEEGGIPEDMTEAERLAASMMSDYGNRMNIMA